MSLILRHSTRRLIVPTVRCLSSSLPLLSPPLSSPAACGCLVANASGLESRYWRRSNLLRPPPPSQRLWLSHQSRGLGSQQGRIYVDPKLSYAYGKSSDHLLYSTVARELDRQIGETPDYVAYVSHEEKISVSFKQLDDDINKLLKAMVKRFNIRRGDPVGLFAYNCYNWLLIQYACARLGAIITPINPSYKPDELAFVLKKGKIKCLFLPGPKSPQALLNNHMEVLQSEQVLAMNETGDLKLEHVILMDSEHRYSITKQTTNKEEGGEIQFKLTNVGLHNWSDVTANDGRIFKSKQEAEEAGILLVDEQDLCIVPSDSVSPDDLFAIYYTSGTTGRPKGACVSNFACINNVRIILNRIRQGRPPGWPMTYATTLPLFHIFAGVLISMSPMFGNSRVIFSSHKYDIPILIETLIEHKATVLVVTPTILIDTLTYIEQHKLADQLERLKQIQSGGAHLSPEVVTRAFKVLPHLEELRMGYGSTENAALATYHTMHEPAETRAITVGPPIDFTEVRIVEPGTDKVVGHGRRGEIQTRGHNTMAEYLDQPDKTDEVLTKCRWYKTGDVGLMHPHGSIQVCGRLKHMIIKGGENIYPEELELMIHRLEFVEDVHVIGVPDKRFGEQVCAWIKLKPGHRGEETLVGEQLEACRNQANQFKVITRNQIINYCKENITYFKVPKYILFVDEFPMTPTKKVQNHLMTEISCKVLNLDFDESAPAFSKAAN